MHGVPSFLQGERGRVILAGSRKRTYRQRANVAERSSDFVGQCKPQKIEVLVGSDILKRKNGNRSCIGRARHGRGRTPCFPIKNGQQPACHRGTTQRNLPVRTLPHRSSHLPTL